MAISFTGLSFEKTINTRVSSLPRKDKNSVSGSTRSYPHLTIKVTEHTDKKTEVTSLKSMFKISTEYAEKLNINGLVGDIIAGEPVLIMHPETEDSKGKIFCFSEKGKEGKLKSRVFKADALLKNLKAKDLVPSDFGSEKGQKINLGLEDISSEIEGLPEDFKAWKVVASTIESTEEETEDTQTPSETPSETTPVVTTSEVTTPVVSANVDETEKDEDLY